MAILTHLHQLFDFTIITKFLNLVGLTRVSPTPGKVNMSPTLGPELSVSPRVSPYFGLGISPDGMSAISCRSLGERTSFAGSASSASIPFEDSNIDVIKVEGLRHANVQLDAR